MDISAAAFTESPYINSQIARGRLSNIVVKLWLNLRFTYSRPSDL